MTIFAWTAPGSFYPAYINIADDDVDGEASIRITVRGPSKGNCPCGETVSIALPAAEYAVLVGHLRHHWNTRIPPP